MELINFLQLNPALFVGFCVLLGASVGSFINVVAYRLPVMMERQWKQECCELLEQEQPDFGPEPFNLMRPASRCPHCGHGIRPWENIPVLGWLLLRGRCSACSKPISPRYPLVELATALLSLVVALHFGVTLQAAVALLLTWALVTLSLIDTDHKLLPDSIVLPVLWLGLLLNLGDLFTSSQDSILGAALGYLSLWSVFQLFRLLTGKEGMGYGDFKLLALFGAWLGWQMLPQIILLSSVVGAVIGALMILLRGRDRQVPIPFGPYLAIAGWISLMWGQQINNWYLNLAGF